MKRILIPINPEHLITYDSRMDNAKVVGEEPCCKYVKQVVYFQFPFLGMIRTNVNHCWVCGRRLIR